MATIDRGDSHFDDAGGWPQACAHMGVFLAWAARRGLAAPSHTNQLARLTAAPGAYVAGACDTKLLPDDFSAREPLIRSLYTAYLPYYASLVAAELGSAYVLGLDDPLLATLDRFLDRELARLAPELLRPATAPEPPPEPAAPEWVEHRKFGRGRVVARARDGERERVTVEFDSVGRKTILAEFLTAG